MPGIQNREEAFFGNPPDIFCRRRIFPQVNIKGISSLEISNQEHGNSMLLAVTGMGNAWGEAWDRHGTGIGACMVHACALA